MRAFSLLMIALACLLPMAATAQTPPGGPGDAAARAEGLPSCRAFGCVFDGAHHPLASVGSVAGKATAGWSAAQWQGLFPGAALNDEIDGLAVQATIDSQAGRKTAVVTLPPGQGFFSKPIATCATSVTATGAGSAATTLTFLPGVAGWRHCAGQLGAANVSTTAAFHGFTLTTLGAGAEPFDLLFGYGNPDTSLLMEDVALRGEDNSYKTQFWHDCGTFTNAGGTIFRGFKCGGVINAPLSAVGDGLNFRTAGFRGAKSAPAFDLQFYDTNIAGYRSCASFHSTTDLGLEGIVFHGLQCGHTDLCLDIVSDMPTYFNPQWLISQMECETSGGIIRTAGAADLVLSDSLILVTPKTPMVDGALYDLISLQRTADSAFHDNVIEAQTGSRFHSVVGFTGKTSNVRFAGNTIRLRSGVSVTSAGFNIPPNLGNTGNRESGTVWAGWPKSQVKVFEASGDPTNVFDSEWQGGLGFEQIKAKAPGNVDRPAIFCTDCRKPNEAAGAGTGMRVYDTGRAWIDTAGMPVRK